MQSDEDPDLDRIEQAYAFARASLKARVIGSVKYHAGSNTFARYDAAGEPIERISHNKMRLRVQRGLIAAGVGGDSKERKKLARELLREVKTDQRPREAEK